MHSIEQLMVSSPMCADITTVFSDDSIHKFIDQEQYQCETDIVTIKHLDMRDNNIEYINSSNSIFSQYDWFIS